MHQETAVAHHADDLPFRVSQSTRNRRWNTVPHGTRNGCHKSLMRLEMEITIHRCGKRARIQANNRIIRHMLRDALDHLPKLKSVGMTTIVCLDAGTFAAPVYRY